MTLFEILSTKNTKYTNIKNRFGFHFVLLRAFALRRNACLPHFAFFVGGFLYLEFR